MCLEYINEKLIEFNNYLRGKKATYQVNLDGSYTELTKGNRGNDIVLTIDSNLQAFAEKVAEKGYKDNLAKQVSIIIMNPNNGEVLALVGGTDYNTSQFNRAISAKRQVGSTMKPFLYYTALESGFTSASSFISEKTTFSFSTKTFNKILVIPVA